MIHGFIIVDKPAGITSHDVVSRVRRIAGTRKVGHTGTLDPFATGVLPVAINDGTKAIPFLDEGSKCYEAVMQVGVATDTLDMTGTLLRESEYGHISLSQIQAACQRFIGPILQTPPMYSAIKQGGQPLYKLARQGVEVERAARPVEIYSLEITSCTLPFVSFTVHCSRGTYVRTLADDIGTVLGTGAALKELRRTASGPFLMASARTLGELEAAAEAGTLADHCISPLYALAHLNELELSEVGLKKVSFGRSPLREDVSGVFPESERQLVRLSRSDSLVAVAEITVASEIGPIITLKRVFI